MRSVGLSMQKKVLVSAFCRPLLGITYEYNKNRRIDVIMSIMINL